MGSHSTEIYYKHRPKYRVQKKRFIPFLVLTGLFVLCIVLLYANLTSGFSGYTPHDFLADQLQMYFSVEMDQGVPWYYLAAVDKAEAIPEEEVSIGRSTQIALQLTGLRQYGPFEDILRNYKDDQTFIRQVGREVKKLSGIQEIFKDKGFPIATGNEYGYANGFGDGRSFGGARSHEGIDIMCSMDVPIVSVGEGTIEQVGWNEYGGWRLGIRGKDRVYYYYAHLQRYEGSPKKGDKIQKGQIIGYAGDTGYGPEGTTGQFAPHLHFGMYTGKGRGLEAFNPYPFLMAWD